MNCELNAGMRFTLIGRYFKKRMDEAAGRLELTGVQLMVLGQLKHLEDAGQGEIRQRDLEKAAHLGHPTMTELLKRLEKKGFVKCSPGTADRRCKVICSTERAHCLHGELEAVDKEAFESLCRGMSGEQREALLSSLDIMLKNAFEMLGKEVCEQND